MRAEARAQLEMPSARSRGYWSQAWRRLVHKKIGLACLIVISVLYMAGILATWVTPYSYREQNLVAPAFEERVSQVPIDSLEFRFLEGFTGQQRGEKGLSLLDGATILFSDMKSVEVVEATQREANVTIELLDGGPITGEVKSPSGNLNWQEEGDLFSVPLKNVRRIEFQPPPIPLAQGTAVITYQPRNACPLCRGSSLAHPFGTDKLGRDQFTRVIYGLRTTVIISVLSVATGALFLGIGLGLAAGYFRGWIDSVINRVGEMFLSFPDILLVIIIAATVSQRLRDWVRGFGDTGIEIVRLGIVDYTIIFGALAAFGWVGMMRIVRGQVMSVRQNQYVEAAVALGASHWRILRVHVFPNILSPIIVMVSMGLGAAAGAEVFLSWLGIGIQEPTPSLGRMIFEHGNIGTLRSHPHLLLFPVGTLAVLLFAFNLLGDALNDALNPRAR